MFVMESWDIPCLRALRLRYIKSISEETNQLYVVVAIGCVFVIFCIASMCVGVCMVIKY